MYTPATSTQSLRAAVWTVALALLALDTCALPIAAPPPLLDGLIDEAALARVLAASAAGAHDAPSPLPAAPSTFALPLAPVWHYPSSDAPVMLAAAASNSVRPTPPQLHDGTGSENADDDSMSEDAFARLPLPQGYERLPADVYARILYVHSMPGFRVSERQALIHQIVESLPAEQRHAMGTRLEGPPPGFERVLAPSVYKQLLFIHYDRSLSKPAKSTLITRVMRQVPQSQLERLPLPAGMQTLPAELRLRMHALVYDYSVPQPERARRVHAFVAALPAELRPPL